jgi:hypothetical protein
MRLGFVRPNYVKTGDRTEFPLPKKQTYMYLEWLIDVAKKRYGVDAQYGVEPGKGHWVQIGIASRRYSLLSAHVIRRDLLSLVALHLDYRPEQRRQQEARMRRKYVERKIKEFEQSLTPEQMKVYKEMKFVPLELSGPWA